MNLESMLCKKLILRQTESGFGLVAENSLTINPGDEIHVDVQFNDGSRGYAMAAINQEMKFLLTASSEAEIETLKKLYREANP